MTPPAIRTQILTPDHLAPWLAFFDGPAFADNPEWGGCYCRCFLMGVAPEPAGAEALWDSACATGENRAAMAAEIAAGNVDGVLAFSGDTVVGWLHMGPVARFCAAWGPSFASAPGDRQPVAAADQAALVCFLVAAEHRRQGVGTAMLRAALHTLAQRGFRSVVAKAAGDAEGSAAHQFTGPLALFEAHDFQVIRAHPHRPLVWRALEATEGGA